MSDGYDEIDDEPDEPDNLLFGSMDEFVREQLRAAYTRVLGPSNRASRCWSAQWWKSAEAIARLESLWRS